MTSTELLQRLNDLNRREKELTDQIEALKRSRAAVRAHLTMARKEFIRRSLATPERHSAAEYPFPMPCDPNTPTRAPQEP